MWRDSKAECSRVSKPNYLNLLAIPVVSQKHSGPLWGASQAELPVTPSNLQNSSAEPSNLEHPEMGQGKALSLKWILYSRSKERVASCQ